QNPNFHGSAIVSADQGIAVSTDVISTTAAGPGFTPNDAIDSYAGMTTGFTSGYVGSVHAYFLLNSNLYLMNTSSSPANVTVTFQTSTPLPMQVTLPPFGSTMLSVAGVAGVPTNWIGVVQVASDQ